MTAERNATFAEHIHELRKRLMWSLLFVAIGAGVGYALHDSILTLLQQPLNERLYYTTPTGAFSFIIKVCCVFGLIFALPMVIYQGFGFFEPLLPVKTRRTFVWYVFLSVVLALSGIAFAYFISLPAALHFLVNFGEGAGDIQALITANEYFNFVLAYIAGFAVLFQLPLLISFINKVTPLKPIQLLGGTRYVILGSFVVSAIITPTPDPLNQALMAGPIIVLYMVSVVVIAFTNAVRGRKNRRRPAVVPEVSTAGIDAVLANEESLRTPAPVLSAPVAPVRSAATRPQPLARMPASRPMRRPVVNDMVVPHRPRPATVQAKPSQPAPAQPIAQRPSQPRVGLISDFMPASK